MRNRSQADFGFDSISFRVFSDYEPKDGIVREQGNIVKEYYYFDYYRQADDLIGQGEILEKDLSKIFSEYNKGNSEKIYASFASLNPNDENEILRWIKFFGLPFKEFPQDPNNPKRNIDRLPNSWQRNLTGAVTLQSVKKEIRLLSWVLDLYSRFNSNMWFEINIESDIIEILVKKGYANPKEDTFWDDPAGRYNVIFEIIQDVVQNMIKNIHPVLLHTDTYKANMAIYEALDCKTDFVERKFDEETNKLKNVFCSYKDNTKYNNALKFPFEVPYARPVFCWSIPTLLSAMYYHLSMDLTSTIRPIRCGNKRCNKFFSPTKKSAKYCSVLCRSRANQQRLWKKKKEEEITTK